MASMTLYALVASFSFGPGQYGKVPLRYYEDPKACVIASAKAASLLGNESTVLDLHCMPMQSSLQQTPQGGEGRPLPNGERRREAGPPSNSDEEEEASPTPRHEEKL